MPAHCADSHDVRTRTRARSGSHARLLTATAFVLVTGAALTGCYDGQGLRDEGPSTVSVSRSMARWCPAPSDAAAPRPDTDRRVERAEHPRRALEPQCSFRATSTAQ
ncbi:MULTISPECIES: hypothetical protein [Streptomyces]|uniref:hypothetical protein n=1 Tax=Streptomyces TaxID=1883 RepID=UPI000F73A5DF|nr:MULTISPECIES: hypothetical protein [Streptomyces]RSS07219.1 hypothetical protein EF917_06105 [Streptomyces sp. WAC00469]WTD48062.1 hypothetical protein OG899_11285 [Streptomyces thermoviolaceus]GGV78160.1 hypothetical protein GCM10010499_38330 [Streptomyces thermoviolaceus subsp. apingens]